MLGQPGALNFTIMKLWFYFGFLLQTCHNILRACCFEIICLMHETVYTSLPLS